MLPSNLLITRRWRDRIRPVYAELSQENIEVAKLIIHTYRDHVGKKKGELNERVGELEQIGCDYRYVRGLSVLLDRRCQLEPFVAVDPVKARRTIFETANKKSLPVSLEERQAVLVQAASQLGIKIEELEKSLYGDLEDEFVIMRFKPVEPKSLVKQYNLSLTQTLLFYSTELTFSVVENWQLIFRQIKWLRLIYTVWKDDGEYKVKVDGPTSLFKLNRRYGTRLAKLLPLILQSRGWNIKAKIFRLNKAMRILNLELNSEKHGHYIESYNPLREREGYDSLIEEDFANRFKALDTGWKLTREPEPILAGNHVMIPDFRFEKDRLKVYLEVVGFWTPQYLEQKIKKLSLLSDVDMIVAVDKKLACHKLESIEKKLNVVYYNQRVPLRPVITHLNGKERQLAKEQARLLRVRTFSIKEPILEAKELAERLGVLERAVKEILAEREFPGYKLVGDTLIKESNLEEIRERLDRRLDQGELNYEEATKIIEKAGVRNPTSVLDALSYSVTWRGIDPKSVRVYKKR